jgi:hypothetical protein
MIVRGFASRLPGLFAQVTLRPILGIPSSGPGYADRDGETDPLGAGGMRCQARAEGVTKWQVA